MIKQPPAPGNVLEVIPADNASERTVMTVTNLRDGKENSQTAHARYRASWFASG